MSAAEIITVGTELLLGQIVDTNAVYLAQQLAELGISLYYKSTVGDNKERLTEIIKKALSRSDLIFITGGLGPTMDDITRESIASAVEERIVVDEEAAEQIRSYFKRRGRSMAESNIRQAEFPEGARAIPNGYGTAPGVLWQKDNKMIIAMPGVPTEFKHIWSEKVIPILREQGLIGETIIRSRVLRLAGIGESSSEKLVLDILEKQDNPTIAPLAHWGEVHYRITARGNSEEEIERMLDETEAKLKERFGDYIYSRDEETLEQRVASLLIEKGKTIAVAESCSGGLISSRLTDIPGSSKYFNRGIVVYSNEAKIQILGVKEEILRRYGAVSSQTAQEMARGVRDISRTDLGLSSTGIAGPTGGTPQKPVGLVYIALADKKEVRCSRFMFGGERIRVKYSTSQAALNIVRLHLIGSNIEIDH